MTASDFILLDNHASTEKLMLDFAKYHVSLAVQAVAVRYSTCLADVEYIKEIYPLTKIK